MVQVKICGITRPEDALMAEALGANAIGMIFVPSTKRCVPVATAQKISQSLGPFVARVGVFRNQSAQEILSIATTVGLSALQLHSKTNIEPENAESQLDDLIAWLLKECNLPIVRAASLQFNQVLDWSRFEHTMPLFDGPDPGSGQAANWEQLQDSNFQGRPWLLAGGLNPENVGQAVQKLRPWGVDVSSGVEDAPGIKNHDKIRLFLQSARSYPQK